MTTCFLVNRGKIKDQETGNRLEVDFVQNKLILHENNIQQLSIGEDKNKSCCLPGIFIKHTKLSS